MEKYEDHNLKLDGVYGVIGLWLWLLTEGLLVQAHPRDKS